MISEGYAKGVVIFGGITALILFIGCWAYCILTYGFLMGVGLGWLPSGIVAIIGGLFAGYLWPLTIIGLIGVVGIFTGTL